MNAIALVRAILQEAIDADLVFTKSIYGNIDGQAVEAVVDRDGTLVITIRRILAEERGR